MFVFGGKKPLFNKNIYLCHHPIRTQTSLAIVAEAVTKGTTTEDIGEGVDGTQTMMVSSPAGRPDWQCFAKPTRACDAKGRSSSLIFQI